MIDINRVAFRLMTMPHELIKQVRLDEDWVYHRLFFRTYLQQEEFPIVKSTGVRARDGELVKTHRHRDYIEMVDFVGEQRLNRAEQQSKRTRVRR